MRLYTMRCFCILEAKLQYSTLSVPLVSNTVSLPLWHTDHFTYIAVVDDGCSTNMFQCYILLVHVATYALFNNDVAGIDFLSRGNELRVYFS